MTGGLEDLAALTARGKPAKTIPGNPRNASDPRHHYCDAPGGCSAWGAFGSAGGHWRCADHRLEPGAVAPAPAPLPAAGGRAAYEVPTQRGLRLVRDPFASKGDNQS